MDTEIYFCIWRRSIESDNVRHRAHLLALLTIADLAGVNPQEQFQSPFI